MTSAAAAPSSRTRTSGTRVPAWWSDVAGLLAWGSMLVVLALWVHGGGLTDLLAGGSAALTTAGRLTGLVAADLMLVQVALMARVPFVERSYGQDQLARRHRLVGFTSFWLLLAHVVLVVLGYAAAARAGAWATAWDMVRTFPGMLLAVAGTGLTLLVVVTSVRAARRRTRYESWHLIHLYGYLGAVLVVPHMLWTGAEFTTSAPARAYWWTAWGTVVAAVLVFRVGLPLYRSGRHRVVVDRVVPEGPGVFSIHLRGHDLTALRALPGHYSSGGSAGRAAPAGTPSPCPPYRRRTGHGSPPRWSGTARPP